MSAINENPQGGDTVLTDAALEWNGPQQPGCGPFHFTQR
jgi:hypothetical protein